MRPFSLSPKQSVYLHDGALHLVVVSLGVGDGNIDCTQQVPVVTQMVAKARSHGERRRAIRASIVYRLRQVVCHIND